MTDVRVGAELASVLEHAEPELRVGGLLPMVLRKRVESDTYVNVGSVMLHALREPKYPAIKIASVQTQVLRKRFARKPLVWERDSNYETGLDRGVFYPSDGPGVVWNGLVSVDESATGGEVESTHFDGIKIRSQPSGRNFQANLQAYSYPREFGSYVGDVELRPGFILTRQSRQRFGFSYRIMIGDKGDYQIHVVYNALASRTSRTHKTISNEASPEVRSFKIDAVPVRVSGFRPSAHFIVDSATMDPDTLEFVEGLLYGTTTQEPQLPPWDRLISLIGKWNPKILIPNDVTGLSELIPGDGDMTMSEVDGIYVPLEGGKLQQTSVPGFYVYVE